MKASIELKGALVVLLLSFSYSGFEQGGPAFTKPSAADAPRSPNGVYDQLQPSQPGGSKGKHGRRFERKGCLFHREAGPPTLGHLWWTIVARTAGVHRSSKCVWVTTSENPGDLIIGSQNGRWALGVGRWALEQARVGRMFCARCESRFSIAELGNSASSPVLQTIERQGFERWRVVQFELSIAFGALAAGRTTTGCFGVGIGCWSLGIGLSAALARKPSVAVFQVSVETVRHSILFMRTVSAI